MFVTALAMAGVSVNEFTAEVILETHKAMSKMGRKFDLKTACKIKVSVDAKYAPIEPPEPKPYVSTTRIGFTHQGDNR